MPLSGHVVVVVEVPLRGSIVVDELAGSASVVSMVALRECKVRACSQTHRFLDASGVGASAELVARFAMAYYYCNMKRNRDIDHGRRRLFPLWRDEVSEK